MLYDVAHYWLALLIALGLGIAVGWFTRSGQPSPGLPVRLGRSWIIWGGAVFLIGLALALLHALPDRPGLWLETALLLFVAYLVGCPIAGLLPAVAAGRGAGLLTGPQPGPSKPRLDAGASLRAAATSIARREPITDQMLDQDVAVVTPLAQDPAEARSRRDAGTGATRALDAYLAGLRNQHAVETQAIGTIRNELPRMQAYPELHATMLADEERSTIQAARLDEILARHGSRPSVAKEAVTGTVATVAGIAHMAAGDAMLKNLLAAIGYKAYEIASYKALLALADEAGAGADRASLERSLWEEQESGDRLAGLIPALVPAYIRQSA